MSRQWINFDHKYPDKGKLINITSNKHVKMKSFDNTIWKVYSVNRDIFGEINLTCDSTSGQRDTICLDIPYSWAYVDEKSSDWGSIDNRSKWSSWSDD